MATKVAVQVKAGSKKGPLIEEVPDGLIAYVLEPAVDGRANQAVVELLAKYYGVSKSEVLLKRGHSSRFKFFEIHHD